MSDARRLALLEIESRAGVRDAAVSVEGNQYSLVVVAYATSESYARTLAEDFVRLLKSLGPDDSPGKEVGRGKYDYVVGVYYPNEEPLALGANASTAGSISWQ